uniref:Neur_chan_memb domain-containing protein n=1 Tax=Angiostrongylus cantonensis TaxID=6313 RepID=A0A0K0CYR5_ANGCA
LQVVNKFALPLVFVVLCCIFSSFLGAFVRFNGSDSLMFCMMGDRPVDVTTYYETKRVRPNCTADGLQPLFCSDNGTCDAYYERVKNVKVWRGSHVPAIRLEVQNFLLALFFFTIFAFFIICLNAPYTVQKSRVPRIEQTLTRNPIREKTFISSFIDEQGLFISKE